MQIKRLTTGEMAHLSDPWVTKGTEANKAILATPELAGLLPRVQAGHQALHDSQPGADNPRLAKVQEKAAGLDLRHDEIVRGVYWLLTALAWLAGGETADSLLRLRTLLFPDGLETAQKTYREEAGATDLLKTRLAADPGVKKQLKEIPVLKQNLGRFIDELVQVGRQLGDTEDERARIAATSGPSDAVKVVTARNQWIRAVNALLANGELAELDEDKSRIIFGALRFAEKAAERRKGTPQDVPAEAAAPQDAAPAAPAPAADATLKK